MRRHFSYRAILLAVVLTASSVPARAASRYIEFILDASGSMNGPLENNQTKISEAKKFLSTIFRDMSKWSHPPFVAIRVFGNAPSKPKDCADSQLILPFGPVPKPEELKRILDGVRPRGQTPLGHTVDLTRTDFPKDIREREIYLITDGKETCGGSVPDVVKNHRAQGKDIRLYIVALKLPPADAAAVEKIARDAGGEMWRADSMDELRAMAQRLTSTLQMPTTLAHVPLPSLTPGVLPGAPSAKHPDEKIVKDAPREKAADVAAVPTPVAPPKLEPPPNKLTDDPHPVRLAKDGARGRARRAGFLSLLVPGLGQWVEGESVRGPVTLVGEGGLVLAASLVSDRVAKQVDRQMRDQYQYQFVRFGAGAEWIAQAAGTVVRFWPHEPRRVSAGAAVAKSLVVPGWGLWSCGYYETALNVLAWEGFFAWWATRGVWINPEHFNGERQQLLSFNVAALMAVHAAQIVMTGHAARNANDRHEASTLSLDAAPGRLGLRWAKRFGNTPPSR